MGCQYSQPKELKSKHFPGYVAGLPRMDGKVVAVTGSTTGTGFVCAQACAKLGATVLLLNRPSERAEAALKAIQEAAPGSKVVAVPCDLTKFSDVRAASEKIKAEFGAQGLDVLCNNAGVMASKDVATEDGCDLQMQTNHLSHFLLTKELFPLLEKASKERGEARIVNHSSIAAWGPKLEAKYLGKNGGHLGGDANGWTGFSGPRWDRYHMTKLANVVFAYALHDKLQLSGSKVKAMVAHPGVAATHLQVSSVKDGSMGGFLANLVVAQSAEDGAMGITKCCCDPSAQSGDFFGPSGMGMAGPAVKLPEMKLADTAARQMLWEESERSTGAKFDI